MDKVAFYEDQIRKEAGVDKRYAKAVAAGVPGAALALAGISRGLKSGALHGRETLYHNTNKANIESILEKGLKAEKALDPRNITKTLGLGDDAIKNKVYFARKKRYADGVGVAYARKESPIMIGPALRQRKTLKANIPIGKYKQVGNPELRGARNFEEYYQKVVKANPSAAFQRGALEYNFKAVGPEGTRVFEGDVGPEAFVKSKAYKKITPKEVAEHIKKNPEMVAKASGVPVAGVSLATGRFLKKKKEIAKEILRQKRRKQLIAAGLVGGSAATSAAIASSRKDKE